MIKAPSGVYARYEASQSRQVLAFDDEGYPLVLGPRGLIKATGLTGFKGIYHDEDTGLDIVQMIPAAPGCEIVFHNSPENGGDLVEPVLAWGLLRNGDIGPLYLEENSLDGIWGCGNATVRYSASS